MVLPGEEKYYNGVFSLENDKPHITYESEFKSFLEKFDDADQLIQVIITFYHIFEFVFILYQDNNTLTFSSNLTSSHCLKHRWKTMIFKQVDQTVVFSCFAGQSRIFSTLLSLLL